MKYYVSLDVGGTQIKAGVLDEKGAIVTDSFNTFDARSNLHKAAVLENILDIIRLEINYMDLKHAVLGGVGIAFPGPFDYERGISFIKGINKYDSLYGVNIKSELMQAILDDSLLKSLLFNNFSIKFENDASLYALGEYHSGKASAYKKSLCICIGTGTGSAFLEEGKLIKKRAGLPENGWIYNSPFKDGIVDDYISSRGLQRISKQYPLLPSNLQAKEIFELAERGNLYALEVFDVFGRLLGEALLPNISKFKPDAVILGGQVSGSFHLFKDAFITVLKEHNLLPSIEISENSSVSTIIGTYKLIEGDINE